jgi:hypothetical protein
VVGGQKPHLLRPLYDQPKGIFSVPALGGNEQLVLEDAEKPEALSDGGRERRECPWAYGPTNFMRMLSAKWGGPPGPQSAP